MRVRWRLPCAVLVAALLALSGAGQWAAVGAPLAGARPGTGYEHGGWGCPSSYPGPVQPACGDAISPAQQRVQRPADTADAARAAAPTATLQAATATPAPTLQAATVTPAPAQPTAAPATPVPGATAGPAVLADDSFNGSSTIMPLESGKLFLDSGGYEMVDAASDPNVVSATPLDLAALPRFTAAATLELVSGDAGAGYGFRLAAGDLRFFIELDQQGRYRVQQVQNNTRTTLLDWTANANIHPSPAPNRLSLDYAAGLLQIGVNGAPAGFVELPGPPGPLNVGLIDDGGKVTAQVRCSRFTVWDGPLVALDDRFQDNAAAWNLGPSFGIGGGILRMDPPPKGADATTYPQSVPPSGDFTALATISKAGGPDNDWIGGFALLATAHAQYTVEIYGDGRYGIDYWQGSWHALVRRSSPALHTGNTSNTLLVRYEHSTLVVGANGVVLTSLRLNAPPPIGQVGLRTESTANTRFSHFLLLQPSSALTTALTPAPALKIDRVVFEDTFASVNAQWSLDATYASIRDHALRVAVRKAGTTAWANTTGLPLGTAYSVSATMQLTAVAHSDTPYGLLFQLDPAAGGGTFLSFAVTPDGYYDVAWLQRGAWQRDPLPYVASDLVMQGTAANRLRVDVLGTVAQLYLNGVRVADLTLTGKAGGGQIGVMTSTGNDLLVSQVQVTRLVGSRVPPVIRPIPRPTPQPRPVPPPLDDPQRVAKTRVAPAVVQIEVASLFAHNRPAQGTGLIVLADHTGVYVLTAHHVVNHVFPGDARRIQIQMPGGRTVAANGLAILPGQAPSTADLALIRLPPSPGAHAAVLGNSDAVDSPDQVLALGFPTIPGLSSQLFVQTGTLQSAHTRVSGLPGIYLAHSATVAEGMSGGPLVLAQSLLSGGHDLLGQVVGINLDYARPASTGPQSITINPALSVNLAVPSNVARRALTTLLKALHPAPYTLPH